MPNKPPVRLFNIKKMETVIHHDFPKSVLDKGYVAVSHVWGEQKWHNPESLGIKKGVNWQVPLSDTNKMDMLKKAMKKFGMEWCWFDVLCMPQDKQGREQINKEIPFMGDYYNGAKMTLVLSDVVPEDEVNGLIVGGFIKGMTTVSKFTTISTYLESFGFDEDPWTERLWTFQEAVMSKQIWLVRSDNSYLDVSDAMKRTAESDERLGTSLSKASVSNLSRAIKDYKENKTSVGRMLRDCRDRVCGKPEDKFYGMLGILGYTNFPVEYCQTEELDENSKNKLKEFMEDLGRKFIVHAYDKNGDVSWLAVFVSDRKGFIPSDKGVSYIGELWREDNPGSCKIKFGTDTLVINACIAANVTHSHKVTGGEIDLPEVYKEWQLHESDITRAMAGHCKLSDGEYENVKTFDNYMEADIMSLKTIKLVAGVMTGNNIGNLSKKFSRHGDGDWKTVSKVTCMKTERNMLMTICGECDVGDKIMILPMYDRFERTLGIVVDESFKRKGICLYPKLDVPYEYTSYEFPL
jgi:hypothetical protein